MDGWIDGWGWNGEGGREGKKWGKDSQDSGLISHYSELSDPG